MIDGQHERSRDELIAEVERTYEEWESLLAKVGDRLEVPFAGTWSVRDVSAHVCAYERFLVEPMGGRVRPVGEMPDEVGNDVQKRNEYLHEVDRHRSTEDVMAEAAAIRAELLARLRAMSEEQVRAPGFMAWMPWPLWRWVVHLAVEHYHEHFPDLRRFANG